MKKSSALIIAVLSALALIVVMFLGRFTASVIFFSPEQEQEQDRRTYEIIRLNSESNVREDGEDSFFRYEYPGIIHSYSLETGEATDYHIELPEGKYITGDLVVVDDWIYYVMSDTVRRFNYRKQEDEEILSIEDIHRMFEQKEFPEYARLVIKKAGKCLLLTLDEYMREYIFVCPVDGNLKTDCIEVNALFLEENKTGTEQMILYQGIRIQRYYNKEEERYSIIAVGEAESGRAILGNNQRCVIRVDEKLISLGHKSDEWGFFYCVEGDSEEYTIDCLDDSEYQNSVIQKDKLTVENGEIIGLLHVVKNRYCNPYDPPQRDLKYDVLFSLNPETGESRILYRVRNNRTRIIGYRDGVVYLMNNYKIYSQTIGFKENTLLLELPQDHDYIFDWQGDYLIVMCEYEKYKYKIVGAYKI